MCATAVVGVSYPDLREAIVRVGVLRRGVAAAATWLSMSFYHSFRGCVAAGGGDAVDAVDVEAAVLAEIVASRSAAEHFRVLSLLGKGAFGYVFKVRSSVGKCARECVCIAARRVCGCHLRQVCCTHPRHPNPRKRYALKLVINYHTISSTPSIARQYGLDCVVLRSLPRHANLCKLLAEFISEVPDDMFEHLTPVRLRNSCCAFETGSVTHAPARVCVCLCVHVCAHVCVYVCVSLCICVSVCARACVPCVGE
jgi:hypothetical protein